MSKTKTKFLSASRIKTLDLCSWLYWVKYGLNLPDTSNSGALRGTLCHNIFEYLLKDKHRKHFKSILEKNSIEGSKAIVRYVHSYLRRCEIEKFGKETYEENYKLVNDMIVVGLKSDFFGKDDLIMGKNAHIEEPEQAFEIKNKRPKYNIRGFMDKPIQYKKDKVVRIVDYKSSKMKFRGEELQSNVQAMMYSLASKTLWPKLKPKIEFLFLKFPKQPWQILEYTDDELEGFEYYLEQVQKVIDEFDEESGKTSFAIDGGYAKKWMCGPTKSGWECPYKNEFEYYVLKNKKGENVKSSFNEEDLNASEGEVVEKMKYDGCPKFQKKKDPFDLSS
jgi:hypothetical protein